LRAIAPPKKPGCWPNLSVTAKYYCKNPVSEFARDRATRISEISYHPCKLIALAKKRFLTMPDTFKSSQITAWFSLTILVDSLCRKSVRLSAISIAVRLVQFKTYNSKLKTYALPLNSKLKNFLQFKTQNSKLTHSLTQLSLQLRRGPTANLKKHPKIALTAIKSSSLLSIWEFF
jgi:hypothetical protein